MTIQKFAFDDFDRAHRKAFWRKVTAWLTKEPNNLLPFDEVRENMPIKGQHYLGLTTGADRANCRQLGAIQGF